MADGSVIFNMELDDKDAQAKFNRLAKTVDSLNDKISLTQRKKLPLLEQAEKLTPVLDAAKAKLAEMQNAPKWQYSSTDISEQKERVKKLQTEWDRIQDTLDKYNQTIQESTIEMEFAQEKAGEIAAQMSTAEHSTEEMAKATKKANKHMGVFATRLRGIVLSAFVFNIMSAGFRELTKWMGNVVKSNEEARASIAKLKGALLTLAQPLVNVILPAFATITEYLTKAVLYIAQLVSLLFGTTEEGAANAAETLYKEQQAIEGVGEAAKKASRQLASFDEINKLSSELSLGSSETIAPDFSAIKFSKLPEWLTSMTVTLSDILFKWENLTAEDILQKVVTSLVTLAGAVIGFSVGGVGGAAVGMTIGATVGALISDLTFDADGKMDVEELLKLLCTALVAVAGGIIGFSVGGVKGAVVGVTVGASVGAMIGHLFFNGDGVMDSEELFKSLCGALAAIAGGFLGFSVGGPAGAAIGVVVGAGITALVGKLVFDGDGKLSKNELLRSLIIALGAIAGGLIGFGMGGPLGALIGATIGAAAVLVLTDVDFASGKNSTLKQAILDSLVSALYIAAGGVIGFAIANVPGALIGMVIGAAVSLKIKKVDIDGRAVRGFTNNFRGAGFGASITTSSIPGFATGSVIPPNREFLAVLGDNKTETEVVSPLSTMKQAMIEAMRESGGGGGTYTFVVNLDGKEVARNQVKHINDMTRQAGKPVLLF